MGVASLQLPHFVANFLAALPTLIVAAAIRSLALAAVAGLLLAAFRVQHVSLRLAAWKLVLWGALAMPLLAALLPPMHFALPSAVTAQLARFAPAPAVEASAPAQLVAPVASAAESRYIVEAAPAVSAGTSEHLVRTAQHHESASTRVPRSPSNDKATGEAALVAAAPGAGFGIAPSSASSAAVAPRSPRMRISAAAIAITLYLAIFALLMTRLVIGWLLGRRLIRASQPIHDHRASLSLSLRAFPGHIGETPRLAESGHVTVPVTLGVARPVILLPSDWRDWDDHTLNAVLAHELSHIGRHDALTQRLSQLHRAIYWFSPLAWWLDRELARLAEEASDEAALVCGADRERYAETLLAFFEAIRAASGRVWWQGVSMAARGDAAERVDRVLSWKGAVSMRLQKMLLVALAAIAVPALFATASIHFTARAEQAPPRPAAAPTPAASPTPATSPSAAPAPASAPSPDGVQEPSPATAPAPAPQAKPAPDAPPAPPYVITVPSIHVDPQVVTVPEINIPSIHVDPHVVSIPEIHVPPVSVVVPSTQIVRAQNLARLAALAQIQSTHSNGATFWVTDENHVRDPYIISAGGTFIGVLNHSVWVDDEGDSDDLYWAKRLRSKIGGDFIWFEHGDKGYVIRDRATIDRAMALYQPIRELSKQQEDLGKQQEALGEKQEALGNQMEDVTVKVPDMSAELDHIKERMRELVAKGGTQSDLGDLQSELGELQSRIGEIESQAGREQSRIGRQQGELGRQQGELGRRQGELGRQEGELSRKVQQQIETMLDEARAKNLAKPEDIAQRDRD